MVKLRQQAQRKSPLMTHKGPTNSQDFGDFPGLNICLFLSLFVPYRENPRLQTGMWPMLGSVNLVIWHKKTAFHQQSHLLYFRERQRNRESKWGGREDRRKRNVIALKSRSYDSKSTGLSLRIISCQKRLSPAFSIKKFLAVILNTHV
jgi:hypothetical protein